MIVELLAGDFNQDDEIDHLKYFPENAEWLNTKPSLIRF